MRREMMWFRWNFYDERKFNSTRKLGTYFRFEMKYNMHIIGYETYYYRTIMPVECNRIIWDS